MTESRKPISVVGDGWAALVAVSGLLTCAKEVCWIAGNGSRLIAPLPALTHSHEFFGELASRLDVSLGEPEFGCFLREFKNKSFREPTRGENWKELLWGPEANIAANCEIRFGLSLAEVEARIRSHLVSGSVTPLKRIEGNPVTGIRIDEGEAKAVILASGEVVESEAIIYADRWSQLPKVYGLPKSLGFVRNRDPYGVLQVTFTHDRPIGLGIQEGFCVAMSRDPGEDLERRVWGYFASDGMRSYWTVCLSSEEVEDNHEIAKKLRRLKGSLDKMFTGPSWLQSDNARFMDSVVDEQVRFEEGFAFGSGVPPSTTISIPGVRDLYFLTDGYGFSEALKQTATLLQSGAFGTIAIGSLDPKMTGPEPEDRNRADSPEFERSGGFAHGMPRGDKIIDEDRRLGDG